MHLKEAEKVGYILDMYLDDASEDFKTKILIKMKDIYNNFHFILADSHQCKECALMHKSKV